MIRRSICKACRTTILWAETTAGWQIALDPAPAMRGTVVVQPGGMAKILSAEEADGRELFVLHFDTCSVVNAQRAAGRP